MTDTYKIRLVYREFERVKTKKGNSLYKEVYAKKMLPNHSQLRIRILTKLFNSDKIKKILFSDEDYNTYGETTAFQMVYENSKFFINYKKQI